MATDVMSSEETKKRARLQALGHENPRMREKAVFDLVRSVGDLDEVIVAVANALRDDDIDVCRQAAVALFMFGAKARLVIPSLIEALQHSDLTIRRAAAATLGLVGPEAKAAAPILRQLENDPDELLNVWVHQALKAIGTPAEGATAFV